MAMNIDDLRNTISSIRSLTREGLPVSANGERLFKIHDLAKAVWEGVLPVYVKAAAGGKLAADVRMVIGSPCDLDETFKNLHAALSCYNRELSYGRESGGEAASILESLGHNSTAAGDASRSGVEKPNSAERFSAAVPFSVPPAAAKGGSVSHLENSAHDGIGGNGGNGGAHAIGTNGTFVAAGGVLCGGAGGVVVGGGGAGYPVALPGAAGGGGAARPLPRWAIEGGVWVASQVDKPPAGVGLPAPLDLRSRLAAEVSEALSAAYDRGDRERAAADRAERDELRALVRQLTGIVSDLWNLARRSDVVATLDAASGAIASWGKS